MITIIYPYRNRDQARIIRSLNSLTNQTNKDFNVLFVDYGSSLEIKTQNEQLLTEFPFVTYVDSYNINQPWSRPRALNIGIKQTNSEYVFLSDIDMIFRSDFVELLHQLKSTDKSYFFQVGYLSKEESIKEIDFDQYKIKHKSTNEAQGLSLFNRNALLEINGHDEFVNFWGADNDVHNRMQNNGIPSVYYDKEVMILHQWHEIYAKKPHDKLTEDLQVNGISRVNSKLQINNLNNNVVRVNQDNNWGNVFTKEAYEELEEYNKPIIQETRKDLVDLFLFVLLKRNKNVIMHIIFKRPQKLFLVKQKAKKLLKGKSIEYYSLKEVNDKILMHLISSGTNAPYTYKVIDNRTALELKIKL